MTAHRYVYYFLFLSITLLTKAAHGQGFSWAQGFVGTGTTSAAAGIGKMAIDENDNSYIVGGVSGSIDVDQSSNVYNVTSIGPNAIFLLKEDALGNFLWVKEFQCKSASNYGFIGPVGVTIDSAGFLYISGAFYDTVDVDPGPGIHYLGTVSLHPNIAVVKLDSLGNFVWGKQIGGGNSTSALGWRDMQLSNTNIYLVAAFGGTIDVDPNAGIVNLTPIGSQTAMVIEKLDFGGNYVWAKQINDAGALGLCVDTLSNLYITGTILNTVDCDPGPSVFSLTSAGSDDIFVEKLDSAGNFQWAKRIGGGGSDIPQGIAVDSFGNVLVTGYYAASTVDFDPGPGVYNITSTSRDMFTLRLRNNGDFSWAISVHPGGNDDGRAVATDGQGNVYTTGEFFNAADFDPGPGVYMLGGGVYVQKLDSSGNFVWARGFGGSIPGWISLDNANNIYVTGSFNAPVPPGVDFDPGPGVFNLIGGNAGFIEKLCNSTFSLTASSASICAGGNVILTTSPVTGATYLWTKNDALITGANSNTYTATQAGTYVIYINGFGCPSSSNPVSLSVTPILQPSVSISGPAVAMSGQQVTVNANVTNTGGPYIINWKNNGVWFAATTVPTVTYTKQPGNDNITATVVPNAACADSTTSNIQVVADVEGISETMKAAGIEVYPNPFADVISIKGLKPNDNIKLLDMSGRVVSTWQAAKEIEAFKIDGLAAGHYLLKIMTNSGAVRVNVPVVKD
jgi:hypothetical protein